MVTTGRIVRGSLWYLSGQLVSLLAALVATPFVIRMLGPEKYGVLALIHVLIGALTWSDLGMGMASTRFGAEAHARGDDDGEVAAIWSGLLLAVPFAALATAVLVAGAPPLIERLLNLPAHLRADATLGLRLAAVGIVARVVTGVLNTPQLVRSRMRLHAALTTAASIAQIAGIPLALSLGAGLVGAGAVIGGVGVATALGQAVLARRMLPQLLRPRFDHALVERQARFGGALLVGNLCAALLASGDKLLLTRLVSVEALAYYSVAFTLANLLIIPAHSLQQVMLPAFAAHQANGRPEELARIYGELLRGMLLLVPPAALVLCFGAKPFFTLWAGPEFGAASTPLFLIMIVGVLATVASCVPGCLLVALGRPAFAARYALIELLPYLLLALAMTARWGSLGAAAALSLRLVVALPIFLVTGRRSLGRSTSALPSGGAAYAAAVTLLLVPTLAVAVSDLSWWWLCVAAAGSLGCYLWILHARLLQGPERAWLRSKLSLVTEK